MAKVARELARHVDDCMDHREKTALAAKRDRALIARSLSQSLDKKHTENQLALAGQDMALIQIKKTVNEVQIFIQRVTVGALSLTALGLLFMVLDKLGWVPLGH